MIVMKVQPPAVLLHAGGRRVAVLVDEVGEHEAIMPRSVPPAIAGIPAVEAAAILADARVAVVLDVAAVVAQITGDE